MKKRLLSLLLAMAMIVSMVPFQALAEEPDETPALLEETEEIVSEPTEETIPVPGAKTVKIFAVAETSYTPLCEATVLLAS